MSRIEPEQFCRCNRLVCPCDHCKSLKCRICDAVLNDDENDNQDEFCQECLCDRITENASLQTTQRIE